MSGAPAQTLNISKSSSKGRVEKVKARVGRPNHQARVPRGGTREDSPRFQPWVGVQLEPESPGDGRACR